MLVGLRTIQAVAEEGKDPKPIHKHLEFIAKKASMCRYKHEAFTGYDSQVRERAGVYGLEVFAEMSLEDVATFFCAENMLINRDKSSKKSGGGPQKRHNKICLNFDESACSYKSCIYTAMLPRLR